MAEGVRSGLAGRSVLLRPISQRDYEALSRVELSDDLGVAWRHRGRTPSPEVYVQTLWNGVLAQFLVVERQQERVVGLVTVYGANFPDGHAYFSAAKFSRDDRSTHLLQGAILLLDYVFANWNLRKLYVDVAEYSR